MRITSGLRALALVSAVALAACGGGGGGGTGGTGGSPAAVASTGVFLDAPVINIGYKTDSQNGNTDGGGRFDYLPGESIVFHIGDLEFPPVLAKEVVTPADMGNRSGDPMIVNISRLLHSLDADLDPSNGLQIPERAKQIAVQLDFDQRIEVFEVIPEVLDLVWNAGQDIPQSQLVSPDWALSNLNDNLLAEGEADDRDGDGLSDPLDQFPDDPDEFWDWDEDGVGDNGDDFPIDPTETTDSDGDGVGDNTDVYPDDQTRNGQPPILYSLTIPNLVVGVPANLEVSYFSEFPSAEVSVLTTIITAPVGSSLEGYSVSGSGLTVTPDVEGAYAFRVEVQDDNGGVYAIFKGVATNTDPVASIAMPVGANVANEVTVDGTGSSDPDGHSIEFDWHLLSRPANSNATLTDPAVAAFTFTPDVGGDYRFELTVTDAFGAEDVTVATLEVSGYALERVAYRVVDAEYIEASDTLVIVGDDRRLYVYDTATHETRVVSLQGDGSAVGVSPDGTRAVVGHNGFISYVDLAAYQVVSVSDVSTDVFDIVLTDDAIAHAMPRRDQWENIRTVNLITGEETLQTGRSVYAGTRIQMHPSENYIYGADNGLSPSDIEKYDIRSGTAIYLYDSPYHGDYAMCGDLWMSDDGLRIFTACGHVFRSSENQATDMVWNGTLTRAGVERIAHLSHKGDEVLYLDPGLPHEIQFGTYNVLARVKSEALPVFADGSGVWKTEGRFVFHKSDGSNIAIVQFAPGSGLLFDFGLAYIPDGQSNISVRPSAVVGPDQVVDIGDMVPLDGSASFDSDGDALTYQWSVLSKPATSLAEIVSDTAPVTMIAPDVKGAYKIELKVDDGVAESLPAVMKIDAEDPADRVVIPLDFPVAFADYSRSLDRLVLLAESPARLIQYTIADGSMSTVDLPESGTVATVSPDGLRAVIGHASSFSIVDLQAETLVDTYAVSSDIVDIEMPGNGYVYVFPRTNQWTQIVAVDLATRQETLSSGRFIHAGTLTDLHPTGTHIYGANNGLSPSDIEIYDITGGNAVYVSDSPYHGDFPMCGNIWVSTDGQQLFTRCGNVFNANPGQAGDMTYRGRLNLQDQIASVSDFGSEVLVLLQEPPSYRYDDPDWSTSIHVFDAASLSFIRRIDLPELEIATGSFPSHGRHVFHTADGNDIVVVMQADPGAGVLNDYSIYVQKREPPQP